MMDLYFSTSNAEKFEQVKHFFRRGRNPPRMLWQQITEILSDDLEAVVREKAIAAYRKAQVPIFVEHGGLYVDYLNGMPGPLVRPFWERLGGNLCDRILIGASRRAHVVQMVCYCDGRTLRIFQGRVSGRIAYRPEGSGIHWEPLFIPTGHSKTMGQMTLDEKLACSGSARAYAQLRKALEL